MRILSARRTASGVTSGVLLLIAVSVNTTAAQDTWDVQIEHLRGTVHLVTATRGVDRVNLVASIGADGVLLSDTGVASYAQSLSAELEALIGGPPRIHHIINTHFHGDHTGGGKVLGPDAIVYAHPETAASLQRGDEFGPSTDDVRIPDVLVDDSLTLRFNGEDVRVLHVPAAHTDGDLAVHFVGSDVLHVGDLVLAPRTLPYSRHPASHADGLQMLADVATAETIVATGHGAPIGRTDIRDLAAVMSETLEAANEAVRSGTSLQALLDGRPTEWGIWESRFLSVEQWLTRLFEDALTEGLAASLRLPGPGEATTHAREGRPNSLPSSES